MKSSSKKVIYAALLGNALIAMTKFIAAVITGSSAMLSEGIHSTVDTGNELLLLYGIHRAKKPADEFFPFGYGKEIYFWSFVVAIFIFAVGAGASLYEGIHHLYHPRPMEHVFANYFVLVLAMIFEGATWLIALRELARRKGRRGYLEMVHRAKNPSVFVVLFEDSAALLGLMVAFFGIMLGQLTGKTYYDGGASIVIGLILGGTAIWLAYEIKGLLVGESAQPEVVQGIRWLTGRYPEIEHVNEVLTMHMGPEFILVNLSVDFKDSLSADQVERTVQKLDEQIKQAYPLVKRIFIEGEARRPVVSNEY
ncbi:MAG: cation diffusion facilitator family transporter [Xanthomonadaceae bacterium]|nr:cation diffusion facilitator family transporter [Xanthomonadaceae bacterium]